MANLKNNEVKMRVKVYLINLMVLFLVIMQTLVILSCSGASNFLQVDDPMKLVDGISKVTKATTSKITPENEYFIGRSVSVRILDKYNYKYLPVSNPLSEYVNSIGNTVSIVSKMPQTVGGYHFIILDSKEINALSAPGGFVFITKGMVENTSNEDQLAAVLAHEVAHIALKHGIKIIKQARLSEGVLTMLQSLNYGKLVGDMSKLVNAFGFAIDDIVEGIIDKGYGQKSEFEADKEAAKYLLKAGYNPNALYTYLGNLSKSQKKNKGGFFSTHPNIKKRQKKVKKVVSKYNYDSMLDQDLRTKRYKQIIN